MMRMMQERPAQQRASVQGDRVGIIDSRQLTWKPPDLWLHNQASCLWRESLYCAHATNYFAVRIGCACCAQYLSSGALACCELACQVNVHGANAQGLGFVKCLPVYQGFCIHEASESMTQY